MDMQQQDPLTLLATLIASSQQQQNPMSGSPQQKEAANVELNAYQKGVNKALLEAGQNHAMEALQSGADPLTIANHPMMSPQQQQIQGDINNQAQALLTPEKRTLLGNLLNTVGNITGIGPMNAAVDTYRQRAKAGNLANVQKLTGTQQGPEADYARVQASVLPQQVRTAQQNAQSSTLQAITQANNSIIDNALKNQELTGTERSAKALSLRAGALKDIGEYNAKLNELTPEETADRMVGIQKKLSETLPGYNVTQSADGKLVIQKESSNSDIMMGMKEEQFKQRRLQLMGDDLDPAKNVRNPYGVAQLGLSRAERIEGLVSAYKDFNLDRRETEELAIALNSMLQGSNVSARSQVESLVPRSIRGNVAKMQEWLFNEPQGLNQQKIVERMYKDVLREKKVFQGQVLKFARSKLAKYNDIRKDNPEEWETIVRSFGIDPQAYDAWKESGFKDEPPIDAANSKNQESDSPFKVGEDYNGEKIIGVKRIN